MDSTKEQRSRERQAQFLRTFRDGTWQNFLYRDANTTRNSFATWYSRTYLKSAEGKLASKATRAEIQNLLNMKAPISIDRDTLLPETLAILQTWEAIPLEAGSPESSKAITRWVKDTAVAGFLHDVLQSEIRGHLSPKEIADARNWIYIGQDGHIQGYQPLAQPWYPKSLQWDNETSSFATVVCIPDENDPTNPTMSIEMPPDQESLRITTATFERLVQGEYEGNRSVGEMNSGPSESGNSISGHGQSPVDDMTLPTQGAVHAEEDLRSRLLHQPFTHQPGTIHAQSNAGVASSPSYSPPLEWEDEPANPEGVPIDPEAQADFHRVWNPSPLPLFTSDD
ncbi:MAG: hypothetical protein Q9184_003902 [Pyrenodesmia sp. 2 TL-2023]